jgi:2-polyprenyl-6-methoxyphenol hydroxylase-like FAD-dependent oxidoreductase
VRLWVSGQEKASISFENVGQGLTPYPFLHIFPQDEHERLLIARLEALGVRVERGVEVVGFAETVAGLTVRLNGPNGAETTAGAAYLAGCDGAHSAVRHGMGVGYPGGTYRQLFYVADVEAKGPPMNGDLNIDLESADFLAIFPLDEGRRARLIGTVREDEGVDLDKLKFDDVSDRAIRDLQIEVTRVNWFSTYHVHHRVTDRFRGGRAFLLGDAAHIHSPAGGQGMNTGIGDAVNLSWKLAAVLRGRARPDLLDSYEAERIGFARRLVQTTDRAFTLASSEGKLAERVRTQVVPKIAPALTGLDVVRKFAFRTVSQMVVNYRRGPLSDGAAGDVWGGDRLPWVQLAGGADNFTPLKTLDWQVHVYGVASPDLAAVCEVRGLDLHRIPWSPNMRKAGVKQNALYLVRPDGYVALAEPKGDAERLLVYLDAHGITPL